MGPDWASWNGAPLEHDEDWAARKMQALERGRQARKQDIGSIAAQLRMVTQISHKFKRLKPLEGKFMEGGFPGALVNASMALALAEAPARASCYERSRDMVLRFFIRHQQLFMR